MVSIERESESEQTLLKHYNLKINRFARYRGKTVKPGGLISL